MPASKERIEEIKARIAAIGFQVLRTGVESIKRPMTEQELADLAKEMDEHILEHARLEERKKESAKAFKDSMDKEIEEARALAELRDKGYNDVDENCIIAYDPARNLICIFDPVTGYESLTRMVTDKDLQGKWSVVIFMPAAFTFNCPTEVEDAAANYAEFQKAGAEVYIVTTDTHFSHKVWHETSPAVGKAKFPLVGDPTHQMTRAFNVHIEEEGLALRGTFVINPEGVIKTMEVHSNEIARDVSETLRKLKAAQFTAANPNQVCPAKWKEGAQTLTPSLDLVGKI